jgi:hypothetical protein
MPIKSQEESISSDADAAAGALCLKMPYDAPFFINVRPAADPYCWADCGCHVQFDQALRWLAPRFVVARPLHVHTG